MTLSTTIFYTGVHPYTLEPLFTATTPQEKREQRSFFFWYEPEERRGIIDSLRRMKRPDLIDRLYGRHPNDPHARKQSRVPTRPPRPRRKNK